MSQARELFKAGDLTGAVEELTREVKANPGDTSLRTFLFELLCLTGDWDRAEKQLDVIGHQSTEAELGVLTFRNNIKAERDREQLYSNGLQPHFLREPPPYVDLHVDAINRIREGNLGEAREILDRAEEERPAFAGKLNDNLEFEDFRDYNDVVGSVLELIINDKYTWLPYEQITRIEFTPPKQLRDLIWTSARIEATDGTIGEVYIPALYANSSDHPDNEVKLGRMTDWKQLSDDLYLGLGLRSFLVNGEDKAMLEIKRVVFDHANAAASSTTQIN